ncbi:unnamed protein product [Prunus armeniaca]
MTILAQINQIRNQNAFKLEMAHCHQRNKRRTEPLHCYLLTYQRNKRRRVNPVKASELPFDVITEILSCLPVDSLLRFRCVCKQWFSLFQDLQFIAKHMDRVRPLQFSYALIKQETKKLEAVVDENFKVLEVCSGLFLEKSLNSQVCRIRNPATHQVLYLPNAHDSAEIKDFVFNPSTHECKVVCVGEAGFQVITVGKDEQWRPLKCPNQDVPQQHSKKALNLKYLKATNKAEGIGHLVIFIVDGNNLCLEIQSLDIWNECFTTTAVPRGFLVDLRKVLISYWNQCVAFAEIAEGKFNMLVLEDVKEHKWSRKQITVPSEFLKDQNLPNRKASKFIVCDMKRGIIKEVMYLENGKKYLTSTQYKPSLIALKGMQSERAGVELEL